MKMENKENTRTMLVKQDPDFNKRKRPDYFEANDLEPLIKKERVEHEHEQATNGIKGRDENGFLRLLGSQSRNNKIIILGHK